MKEILTVFQEFTGSGFLTILYLLALLYLWMTEKNATIRAILVYGASVIQLLFFVPFFYYGYQLLDGGTYYRVLWILPMTVTISYAGVKILGGYPKGSIVIGIILIAICGKCVYSNPYITKAENLYHIPQEVIEVCDIMMPDEDEGAVKGIFPDELIHYVRQYSSKIHMAYGRDYLAPDWIYGDHPIREIMNQDEIKVSELVRLATEQNCQYIIVEKTKETVGKFEKFKVTKIGETTNYNIYRNYQVDIEK